MGLSKEEITNTLVSSLEYVHIITDNNTQLIQFISEQVLSKILADQSGSQTKLMILDFLCQLAQSKFSSVEKDRMKYSTTLISERRKKIQEDRLKLTESKKAK